jgi:hypothetical protein
MEDFLSPRKVMNTTPQSGFPQKPAEMSWIILQLSMKIYWHKIGNTVAWFEPHDHEEPEYVMNNSL